MQLKAILNPRHDAPLPLWMIFPVIFAAVYATHFTLLRLPYYWDEAGYYIPAAWDFFRTGSLIPITTITNAHPPLPSVYLALWWQGSGFYPEVTREAVLMVAALGLLGVWRLSMRLTGSVAVAFWTTLLTGLYPIWFAQSSLAHADIFAAACSLWGMVYALPSHGRRPMAAALWFSAAAQCKETAVAIPVVLAILRLQDGLRFGGETFREARSEVVRLLLPVVLLAGWYDFHWNRTGFLFGNPEFLRYNALSTLTPLRVAAALGHRILHLTAHMNMFVPVGMGLAALLLNPRIEQGGAEREGIGGPALARIWALLAVNALLFSVLGGALLTRYLLPMYPLVLLLTVTSLYRRAPLWHGLALVAAGAFVAGLFLNPPYGFAPEDNLAYASVIRMDVDGIRQLAKSDPGSAVLTAWPLTDALTRPELGYVKEPWTVCPIDDFSEAQIEAVNAANNKCGSALVFSTKYDPPQPFFDFAFERELSARYFGMHHDLTPEEIAAHLNGTIGWRETRQGFWIALIKLKH